MDPLMHNGGESRVNKTLYAVIICTLDIVSERESMVPVLRYLYREALDTGIFSHR